MWVENSSYDAILFYLWSSTDSECTQYNIYDSLGGQHITPDNGCILWGVKDTASGDDGFYRLQTSLKW